MTYTKNISEMQITVLHSVQQEYYVVNLHEGCIFLKKSNKGCYD